MSPTFRHLIDGRVDTRVSWLYIYFLVRIVVDEGNEMFNLRGCKELFR